MPLVTPTPNIHTITSTHINTATTTITTATITTTTTTTTIRSHFGSRHVAPKAHVGSNYIEVSKPALNKASSLRSI